MAYPVAEQETTIVYEHETKVYTIYTTVPKHIRRLFKRINLVEVLQVDKDVEGECIAIKARCKKLPPFSTFS